MVQCCLKCEGHQGSLCDSEVPIALGIDRREFQSHVKDVLARLEGKQLVLELLDFLLVHLVPFLDFIGFWEQTPPIKEVLLHKSPLIEGMLDQMYFRGS